MTNVNTATRDVAKAIDASNNGKVDDNLIRLSTGVVLLAKQANPHILIRVMTAVPRPTPPLYRDEMMGREVENPNHPDYIAQVKDWDMQYNSKMLDALIGLGTELHSVPKGFEDYKGSKWLKEYKAFGLPTNEESESWRYITWVLFKAAVVSDDTKLIGEKVKALSGVTEAAVRDAETFSESDQK